jgi:anti-anti-sigma factor
MKRLNQNDKKMIRRNYIESNIIYTLRKTKRIDILIANIIKETIEKDILKTDSNRKINLIIDLKGIKFIDSYGFRVLLELARMSEIYNKPLFFMNISEEIDELISLLKLEKTFINRRINIPHNKIAA